MDLKKEITFQRAAAKREAGEVIERAAQYLESVARELRRYGEKVQSGNDKDGADNMNWALHHATSNVLGNLRVDLMAKVSAEFCVIHELQRHIDAAK